MGEAEVERVKEGEKEEGNMNLWTSNQHFHKAANAKWV